MTEVDDEGKGWILKAPYVQNSLHFPIKHVSCADKLPAILRRICEVPSKHFNKVNTKSSDVFDYLILQPRMKSNGESKIILHNGKAQYVASKTGRGVSSKFEEKELFEFAEKAWNALRENSSGTFLCDGLSRVDLFSNKDGHLVVNEYENLDATYSKLGGVNEINTKMFLTDYFFNLQLR